MLPAVLLAITAAVTTGCGSASEHTATHAPAAAPSAPADGAGLVLPLDRYLLGPHDTVRVARAYRVLLNDCASGFGITPPPDPPAAPLPRTWDERRYGITDLTLAAAAGYRLSVHPPPVVPRPTSASNPHTLDVLTGRGAHVVAGRTVPAGGCSGEATRHLNAGAPRDADPDLAQNLSQRSYFRSKSDQRVLAAQRSWSTCMNGHGYHYPDPLAAAADKRFRSWPVTPLEIATAKADIACKNQTDLVGIRSAVESDLQRADIAANRPALEKVSRVNDAQLAVVRALGLR
jgi:hypothetical protein